MQIGPHRVTGELGRGGAGVVYAAGPDVAVKPLARGDPEVLLRELRTLATLNHPGIVRILRNGLHDGRPWLAMARVHGPTLQDRLPRPDAAVARSPGCTARPWCTATSSPRTCCSATGASRCSSTSARGSVSLQDSSRPRAA
jgi:serine/threonine protein kinase